MPPKIVTEHERAITRHNIMEQTMKLIVKNNGINCFTVDSIAKSVGISKGSFYSYFISKEECIHAVIEESCKNDMLALEDIFNENIPLSEKVFKFVKNVFLGENGLARYIEQSEYELVLNKLPPVYRNNDENYYHNTLKSMMEILDLERKIVETVLIMLGSIGDIANNEKLNQDIKDEAIKAIIYGIAKYIEENSKQNHSYSSEFKIIPMQELIWLNGF